MNNGNNIQCVFVKFVNLQAELKVAAGYLSMICEFDCKFSIC